MYGASVCRVKEDDGTGVQIETVGRRTAVQHVSFDRMSQTQRVCGVDTKLVRPSCERMENDIYGTVVVYGYYFIAGLGRLALGLVGFLPRSFIMIRAKREAYCSVVSGLESHAFL